MQTHIYLGTITVGAKEKYASLDFERLFYIYYFSVYPLLSRKNNLIFKSLPISGYKYSTDGGSLRCLNNNVVKFVCPKLKQTRSDRGKQPTVDSLNGC